MKRLDIIGRVLFAIPFIIIGLSHLFMSETFLSMLEHSLFPSSLYAIFLSGIMLIVGGVSILINKYIKIACLWIAGMLFFIIVSIHIPNLLFPEHFDYAFMQLLKDISLLGASLMISYFLDEKNNKN